MGHFLLPLKEREKTVGLGCVASNIELVAWDLIPLRDLLQRRRAENVTCSYLRFSSGEAVTK
jgi:hypothetical protein